MWLFLYPTEKWAAAALTARLLLKPKMLHYSVKAILRRYCKVVNNLLETYAKGNIIAEKDRKIVRKASCLPCRHWNLRRSIGLTRLDVHTLMMSAFLSGSVSKDPSPLLIYSA